MLLLRLVASFLVLPAFVVAKDTALDQMAGYHCLGQPASTSQAAFGLCFTVAPDGRRTHVGTRLLDRLDQSM